MLLSAGREAREVHKVHENGCADICVYIYIYILVRAYAHFMRIPTPPQEAWAAEWREASEVSEPSEPRCVDIYIYIYIYIYIQV